MLGAERTVRLLPSPSLGRRTSVPDYPVSAIDVPSPPRQRRPVVAVIGGARATSEALERAEQIGRAIIERGWRLVTGGLGGVMQAASRGAHLAPNYREGDVLAFLPGDDRCEANPWADIVVPTGMGHARNVLVVAAADVVVAVGGAAGTLSEMALAWQLGRPIVGVLVAGYSQRLAGAPLDDTRPGIIWPASDALEVVAKVAEVLGCAGTRAP